MSKVNENWIGWNYKSRPDEIIELVLDEVNDMLKKNNITTMWWLCVDGWAKA